MEAWDAFKVSAGKVIRDSFAKRKLPPLIPTELTTNNQAYYSSVQLSSGSKSEEINEISHQTVVLIEVQETRTYDNMVVLQSKVIKQSPRNIFLQYAEYEAARKPTKIPIHEMKRYYMTTL